MNELLKGKITLSLIMIIAVAATAVVGISLSSCRKNETIKIGAILSLSGPASYTGKEVRDGMLLAVNEINSRGGIDGRKIELIIVDSKSNPQEGKELFNNIESAHHPLLYVSVTSSVCMALAPLSEENEVVLIGLVATIPKLTEQKEWVFRYWPTADIDVPPILFILEKLKVRELGILYVNDEYGRSVFAMLEAEFEAMGGTVESKTFEPRDSDFQEQIVKLKNMDAIYTVGFPFHVKNVFKQLKKGDFRGFALSTNSAAVPGSRSIPEANGVYLAATIIYSPDFLFARELREKYEAKYDKPLSNYAANGYDFVKLLSGLVEDREVSRENVKSAFEEGFIYSGVFGTLDVQPGEHDITVPLHPAQIVDGEINYLR